MTDMWRTRAPPDPLDFNAIISTPLSDKTPATPTSNGHSAPANALRDQKALTLRDMLDMFVSRYLSTFLKLSNLDY